MENRERERERERERGIGWPLGLGSMYMRLRLMESLGVADPTTSPSNYFPSTSFSSFTSSNLDTESTVSFFQDKSKTLGRLIGIRSHTTTRRSEYSVIVNHFETPHQLPNKTSKHGHGDELDMETCDGLCLPFCFVPKICKNKDASKEMI